MSKLQELINELCPNGVEWKSLGEVCELIRGKGLSKNDKALNGSQIILYGELYTTYGNYINNIVSYAEFSKTTNSPKIIYGDLLLPISSTTKEAKIGKVSVYKLNSETYLGSDAVLLRHNQNPSYLMYVLNSNLFESEKMKCVNGTTINHLIPSKFLKLQIPLSKCKKKLSGFLTHLQNLLQNLL